MRYAIFSDLHDSLRGLELILADAQAQNADELVYLGDAGHDPAVFSSLHAAGAVCVFGNWEVGGYRRLVPKWSAWVAQWPAAHALDAGAQCMHATPALPDQVQTTEDARYLRRGQSARALFPRLHTDEMARWEALAALETADCCVAFHGHTHVQMLWRYAPVVNAPPGPSRTYRWQSFLEPGSYAINTGARDTGQARYLVGVGSAGEPHDGPWPRYVIYDSDAATIELRALSKRL